MKVHILGCGTSSGVPRLGGEDGHGDWGKCDPANPLNRRTRSSALVEEDGFRLLIDTGPDLRAQLLACGIAMVDAVFWTHDHADHCHGIDDLRALFHRRGSPIRGYGSDRAMAALERRFGYVFHGNHGYSQICSTNRLADGMRIGAFVAHSTELPHGGMTSTAIRLTGAFTSMVYAIDFNEITDELVTLSRDADLLVVDCLRERPHPTHAHVGMALDLVQRSGAKQAVLVHMDSSLDHAMLSRQLPPNVRPGHDGMVVELG